MVQKYSMFSAFGKGYLCFLKKIFVFKYSETVFHVVFIWNMQEKMLQELFWLHFLRHPICLNSSKIHLGVHYPLNALLILVFQPHYKALSGFKESKLINIRLVRLSSQQWPKFSCGQPSTICFREEWSSEHKIAN